MPQCVQATLLLSESTNFYGSGSAFDDEDGTSTLLMAIQYVLPSELKVSGLNQES